MEASPHDHFPLPTDLRKRVIKAVDGGMSCRSAAKQFGVAPSTAIKWVDRWRRTGSREALPQGGDRRSWRIAQYADEVLARIEATPDITPNGLADWLEEAHGLKISHVAVWRMLKRHDVTCKKRELHTVFPIEFSTH